MIAEELRYALLRAASELFGKQPSALAPEEWHRAEQQARREFAIEQRILESPEAARVVVPEVAVERAFQEVRSRYADGDAFVADLAGNGLDEPRLRSALARQCRVESVLDLVGSRAPTVNEIDIAIYYHSNPERFRQSERREAYHILLSINPEFRDNTREEAERRIRAIAARLCQKPNEFERLATRHSECPTALQGGRLGLVPRGTLYQALDEVLFALKPGRISDIVESPMGFHILWCKHIEPVRTLSLQEAAGQIRRLLEERHRRICQRAWIAALPRPEGD